ncbi:hypothetical protein [Methanogenium organophilum]|uniref:Uncharacterized protein n=1 Tax=Methanogenium organophilum TaxID=2199 RepID=A0A9X9T916_METOG|nr:hypothetical protein [Methanogenium organophilum]WAI02215.1 hypothetical protein OU421_04900 [Methanogenium organophilum]
MRKDISIISAALLVLLVAAAVISAGCTGNTDTTGPETVTPTPAATADVTPAPTDAAPSQTPAENSPALSGNGDVNTTVALAKGVHLLTFTQDTPEKSTVSVMTETDAIMIPNAYNATVAEQSMKDGAYYWTQAFMVQEDATADVQVTTTGNWTLDFSFPQQINGIVPQTFTGAANKATPFFQINAGTYNFSIKAENNDVIAVHLMDFSGNDILKKDSQMPLAFHRGAYDGVVTVQINESSNYLFNVMCDGNWTVSVAEA